MSGEGIKAEVVAVDPFEAFEQTPAFLAACLALTSAHQPTARSRVALPPASQEPLMPEHIASTAKQRLSSPAATYDDEQPPRKLLVPAKEAAAMLSLGRSTFWQAVKNGHLPQPIKIGGSTRWRVSDLLNALCR